MGAVILPPVAISESPPAPDVPLTADVGQDVRTLDLGGSRKSQTIKIRFVAATKLPATPEGDVTDAQTSDGRKLDGTLALTPPAAALTQGGRTAIVTVKIDPAEDATAGSYDSQLLVRAAGVSDARSKLTIKLDDKPVRGSGFLAAILLLLGAGAGVFAKWIAGTASTLKGIEDRLATVGATVSGHEPLPAVFRSKLIEARTMLANDDATDADALLKADLEGQNTIAAIDVADKAKAVQRKIDEHEKALAALPGLDADLRGKLEQVLQQERDWLEAMVQDSKYAADAQAEARAGRITDAQRFSAFLAYYRDAATRGKFAEALESFVAGDFAKAETLWRDAAGAPAAEVAVRALAAPEHAPMLNVGAPPSGTTAKRWLIHHAPLLAQAFTALFLVILGLFTVYDPSKTLRGDHAFLDAITLIAWGLGSALAGGGISDIAGKLTAGRPAPA
jgi:hypothetical protein